MFRLDLVCSTDVMKMLYDLNNMMMLLWESDQGIDIFLDMWGRL